MFALRSSIAKPAAPAAARTSVRARANAGWLPGAEAPSHLNGSLPGDRGFDPLGLGSDPDRLKWYAEAEKMNGRWAMAACAGILFTDFMGLPKWYEAGAAEYASPGTNGQPILPLIAIEAVVMGFLETKRYQGFKETGKSGFLNAYPFDPAGMNSASMAEKEVKNGRLAMVAFAGFAIQAVVTRTGPVEGLGKHLADPFGYNIGANVMNIQNVISQ
ncbi:unnamed protein product [Pedinophyceae sp. YPF-701]|nr:unnamed protein product [Pedinophyceae sp. YPF-701]